MRAPQAYQRATPPTTQMDAWPVWHGNQYWGSVLPVPGVCVRLLPADFDGGARHYELVRGHVRWNSDHRSGVLCVARTAPLHPTRGAGEARDVIYIHLYNCYVIEG